MNGIARRAGYPPAVPPGAGVAGAGGQAPGQVVQVTGECRAAVSPRMMKMNNIADFVLGSTSPKQMNQMTGIENNMGRMNIGQLMQSHQEDVNMNKTDAINAQTYNENSLVCRN